MINRSVKEMNRKAGLYRKNDVAVASMISGQQLEWYIREGRIPAPTTIVPWSAKPFYTAAEKKLIVAYFEKRRANAKQQD